MKLTEDLLVIYLLFMWEQLYAINPYYMFSFIVVFNFRSLLSQYDFGDVEGSRQFRFQQQ